MLYLVTNSDHYYPQSGTWDWVGMTTNPEEAVALYESLDTRYSDAFIVSINPETCTFVERDPEDLVND